MLILALIYFVTILFVSYKNFAFGLYSFALVLPLYFLRPQIGFLPTTILEIHFGAVFLVWLFSYAKQDWSRIKEFLQNNKLFSWGLFVFFVASFASIFVSAIGSFEPLQKIILAAGIWRAYFLEPIILFFILVGRQQNFSKMKMIWAFFISAFLVSLVAVAQEIFFVLNWQFPYFGMAIPGRMNSVYTTPNAIGLFTLPILFLSLFLQNNFYNNNQKYFYYFSILIILLANFFSFSQGAWVALAAASVVYLFFVGYKKFSISLVVLGMMIVLVIPSFRSVILFQDKAGNNRFVLAEFTWDYLTDSPRQFVTGAGLRNFYDAVENPRRDPKKLEPLTFPHNIFLNFWSEVGLFGMLSFVFIYFLLVRQSFKLDHKKRAIFLALLVAIFVQGLVDVPYFKNDLAFAFWIIVFFIFFNQITLVEKKSV
ncbi:MAG: O-antigen ligase family protein [Candidatus Magasanikbacteria bacterium]